MIDSVVVAAPAPAVDHRGVGCPGVRGGPGVREYGAMDPRLLGLHPEMILRCCQITPRDAARCEVAATMGPVLVRNLLVVPNAVLPRPRRYAAALLRCPPTL